MSVWPRWTSAILVTSLSLGCGEEPASEPDVVSDASPLCERDDSEGPETALALTSGDAVTGWLCPVGDSDWYRFETAPNDHLITVRLSMDGDLSPVEPAYTVWSQGGDGLADALVAAPPDALLGQALDQVHCAAPGPHFIAIRDDGDDAQDFRRRYQLQVQTAPDPDPAEPNDDAGGAVGIVSGAMITGAIACAGDEDWHSVTIEAGERVRVTLTSEIARYEPTIRIQDATGALVGTATNPSSRVAPTAIDLSVVIAAAGSYHVIVADDDGRNADPDVDYVLTFETFTDPDPNEPNGHPDVATPLAASDVPCGVGWSGWLLETGTIGAPGDNDWFRLPLSGCGRGVLEAEVELDVSGLSPSEQWQLAQDVQATLTAVREHTGSPCSQDSQCQALAKPCGSTWDCSGLFNACLPDGFCAGASVCLPEGECGANIIQRRHLPPAGTGSGTPPPNRAVLSTPIFGDAALYLRVSDFQANGSAPNVPFTLRARVRADPDSFEPSNVYAPELLSSFPVNLQTAAAKTIPVHDCTGLTPDCCDSGTWIEGAISYENDLDFYRYLHPCPGEDCNLRVHYQLDGGAVDFVVSVYRGSSLWFGGVIGATSELESQPGHSGTFGGVGIGEACFYAYQGHTGDPYRYHLGVRDLANVREWDSDQRYRLCVEKVSNGCEAPCQLFENGCDTP